MLALVEAQEDIAIAELRDNILAEKGVAISWTLTRNWVKRLGLRLDKSRSTPSNATRISFWPIWTMCSAQCLRRAMLW